MQAPANARRQRAFFSSQGLVTPNAVVTVIGDSNVKIDGLTVEGPFTNTDCSGDDFGVLQVGGQLAIDNDQVLNVEAANQSGLGGCQYGVGIQAGREHWATTAGGSSVVDFVGNAKITSTQVSGYQKNGLTADGSGTTIVLETSRIDGGGQTSVIARNGVQVSRGATGKIDRQQRPEQRVHRDGQLRVRDRHPRLRRLRRPALDEHRHQRATRSRTTTAASCSPTTARTRTVSPAPPRRRTTGSTATRSRRTTARRTRARSPTRPATPTPAIRSGSASPATATRSTTTRSPAPSSAAPTPRTARSTSPAATSSTASTC